jgi:hypothetical protein
MQTALLLLVKGESWVQQHRDTRSLQVLQEVVTLHFKITIISQLETLDSNIGIAAFIRCCLPSDVICEIR